MTRLIAGFTGSGRVRAKSYQRREILLPATPAPMCICWPMSIKSWKSEWSGDQTDFCSANTASTVRQRSSACRRSRWRRFTGSAIRRPTGKRNTTYQPTRPTPIPIGQRRKPRAGRPPRVSAHRYRASGRSGRQQRGISHQRRGRSNTVGDCGRHTADIGERWLIPVLEQLLEQFSLRDSGVSIPTTAANSSTTGSCRDASKSC